MRAKNIVKTKVVLNALLLISILAIADPIEHSLMPLKVQPKAPLIAKPFRFNQVKILEGPFKESQDSAVEYLLSLEVDRLLAWFRKEAGLNPKAEAYGGWERTQLAGHSLGHYLSAVSIAYAITGNKEFLRRARYIVDELANCQQAHGDGYIGAIPEGKAKLSKIADGEIEAAPFNLNGLWSPFYTLHKLMAGLRDAYRLCKIEKALEVEKALADWIDKILKPLTEEQMQKVLICEYGGMNEVLADLYVDSGDPRYLYLARRFYDKAVLDAMVNGIDVLPGKHANTQIPKLTGLATLYVISANPRDRRAAEFFWDRVVKHHSYVTGGNGDREHFGPPDHLSDRLSQDTTETCNVYNMLKLTTLIFGWHPLAEIADYYERALLNHILSSHHPDGRVIYNLTLQPGGFKIYQTKYDSFTCCVGTGMENHLRYGEAIYYHDEEGLWINLYIGSELSWPEKGLRIEQQTRFPFEEQSKFVLHLTRPTELTLRFRRPHWAISGLQIEINGTNVSPDVSPTGYFIVRRTWQDGDYVIVKYPMSLRIEQMPDNERMIAIFYGPTLLAADIGPVDDPNSEDPLFVPVLVTNGRPVEQWIQVIDKEKLYFRTVDVGRPKDIELKPFFHLHDRRYTVYFKVLTPLEWEHLYQAVERERAQQEKIKARLVDEVRIGERRSERAHNLKGERTESGEAIGRRWRHATEGGWFSYEVKGDPEKPVELVCTYWGSDSGNRIFDILVDEQRIATQRLNEEKPNQFFDVTYHLPFELTKGKEKLVVKFQAHPGAIAGGIFGLRIMRQASDNEPSVAQVLELKPRDVPPNIVQTGEYLVQSIPFWEVKVKPGFWFSRIETNRIATIWHCISECEKTARIDNFLVAAGKKEGEFKGLYFNDSDVYKTMEAMAYVLMTHPDPALEGKLEELISIIAEAQEEDGYIYTPRIIKKGDRPPGGWQRWAAMDAAHELYCMGHLIEAAVAHYIATKRDSFLKVACKAADLICKEFNECARREPCGHQEIELALIKLFRVTGDPKYLRQAYFFLEQRGRPETHRLYGTYSQDHIPVSEQREAVGHAVRAAYMYCAMTDVAALLNNFDYVTALEAIWKDIVSSKIYITGGIGAAGGHEGFDEKYVLPNLVAYCETCAAIANVLWNYRMFLLTGDGKYLDVLEQSLYNNVLSGVSLDGKLFFYPNPLESDGRHARSPWFACACCPPNIARLIPQIPSFAYGIRSNVVYVAFYIPSEVDLELNGQQIQIEQQTQYPWSGTINIKVHPKQGPIRFTLAIRIPGWAQNKHLPGGLYWFADNLLGDISIKVNNRTIEPQLRNGFAYINRQWNPGDIVEVQLPMEARRVLAHPNVKDNRGKVALQRGPIVYCVEWPEVEGGNVVSLVLPDGAQIIPEYQTNLLGGIVTLKFQAVELKKTNYEGQYDRRYLDVRAIPYYAWAHRGRGEMAVWLAREEWAARALPLPTIASRAVAKASGGDVRALNDQREPSSSGDHSNRYLHWWPRKGTTEWVEYHFDKQYRVYGVELYWFDDTGRGECRIPASWRLFYRKDGQWVAVSNPTGFGCEKDKYNRTTFDPVVTDGLRIEVNLQPNWSAGIHEWKVLGDEIESSSNKEEIKINEGMNLIRNASFEDQQGQHPAYWGTQRWGGSAKFEHAKIARSGIRSVAISSDEGADVAWTTFVRIEPFGKYKLSGWIKTEDVKPGTGRGALLNIHNLQGIATSAVTGTKDWTYVEVVFEVDDIDQLQINCLFGGWGQSTGKAWYDDIELVLLERRTPKVESPSITIYANETFKPLTPLVYGQFIEHLGRCIYGGIWAEMLEDRKFYYNIGQRESPWQPIGPRGSVQRIEFQPLAGIQDVMLVLGNHPVGIQQSGLGLKAGMDYIGRIWFAAEPTVKLTISLVWGPEPQHQQDIQFIVNRGGYNTYHFHFTAGRTTTNGILRITAMGPGYARIGAVSLMPADALLGLRWDTLEYLRQLDSPIYRWPGGNFVSGYDWRDGIGECDRRPPRKNPAWQGVEHNDFGIDEFIQFCRVLRAEPFVVINTGLGDLELGLQLIEYVNGSPDSPMGRLRAQNGHTTPYNVKYWGIGNEMFGSWQLGFMPVEAYVRKHNLFAKAIRDLDPNLILIGVGEVGPWDEMMLRHCADYMDLISEHFYCQERTSLYAHMRQIPMNIRRIVEAHRKYKQQIPQLKNKSLPIAIDEWNYWYGPYVFGELGTRYFLKDALGIAAGLHEYARQADIIGMANYAQTVNVIGCIKTSPLNAQFETTGLVLKLYRHRFGVIPVRTEFTGLIDAQAAWTVDHKRLTLGVVNATRDVLEIPIKIEGVKLKGTGYRWEIADNNPNQFNDPDMAPRIVIKKSLINETGNVIRVSACSVTLFEFDVAE